MLGKKVKDKISGFTGIVTSHATHMNGCDRVWISPPVDKDGKLIDGAWFDVVQLEVLPDEAIKPQVLEQQKPGGPVSTIK